MIIPKFRYVLQDYALLIGIYLFLVLICIYLRFKTKQQKFSFESTYQTVIKDSYLSIVILGVIRLIFFLFILIGSGILNWTKHEDNTDYQYFTHWNIGLISIYYLLALICSIYGISNKNNDKIWSDGMTRFGELVYILFEIVGPTAPFITVFVFLFLSRSTSYSNITEHVVTTATLLVELSLNSMVLRFDHLPFTLTWAIVYAIVAAILTTTDTIKNWPYTFLYTDKMSSLIWYAILIIAGTIAYIFWWTLTIIKAKIFPHILYEKKVIQNSDSINEITAYKNLNNKEVALASYV